MGLSDRISPVSSEHGLDAHHLKAQVPSPDFPGHLNWLVTNYKVSERQTQAFPETKGGYGVEGRGRGGATRTDMLLQGSVLGFATPDFHRILLGKETWRAFNPKS